MVGSVPRVRVAFITEPVIVTRPVRLLADWLVLPDWGRTHGIDLGVGNRLALDSHLVALPSLGLGHHLGDQIPTQPHLTRLAPTEASTTLWPSRRLVHERPAHPLTHREPIVPGGFNRLPAAGGRQLIASTAPAGPGLDAAGVKRSVQARAPGLRGWGPGRGVQAGVGQPPGRGAGRLGDAGHSRPRLVGAFWLAGVVSWFGECLASRCAVVQGHGVVVEPVVAVQL